MSVHLCITLLTYFLLLLFVLYLVDIAYHLTTVKTTVIFKPHAVHTEL